MKINHYLITLILFAALLPAKAHVIEHVDPPSWFTGMKEESLQLMVYGKEIGSYTVTTDYPGIEVKTMVRTDNPNYLFVYLNISDKAIPGTASLTFTRGKQKITHNYPLLSRPAGPARDSTPPMLSICLCLTVSQTETPPMTTSKA